MRKSAALCMASAGLILAAPSFTAAQAQTPDFPLRCRGSAGMASTSGRNLIVDFAPGRGPAGPGLNQGQCSWLDRALRQNEPVRIVAERPSIGEARNIASAINRGETWTFWVFNVGRFFRANTVARGAPSERPKRL